jgi:hypothetical protein
MPARTLTRPHAAASQILGLQTMLKAEEQADEHGNDDQ